MKAFHWWIVLILVDVVLLTSPAAAGTNRFAAPAFTVPVATPVLAAAKSKKKTHKRGSSKAKTAKVEMPTASGEQFAPKLEGVYNYCPSVFQEEDGTRWIYYCTNTQSRVVVDHVACRKGTPQDDGTYQWGDETIVLAPSKSGWDSMHVCDPSVIAGKFTYKGRKYGYLMAYLGCTSTNNQENKLGLAVAEKPEGPFLRVGEAPFVDFKKDPSVSKFQWGVGQPSLVNMGKAGKVWLFYTRGDKTGTHTVVEQWNLTSLDKPKRMSQTQLAETGLTNLEGRQDFLNNADFVYDAKKKVFYAVSDCHPNPKDAPEIISAKFRVTYFGFSKKAPAVWHKLVEIGAGETTFPRNHNAGIVRDEYGNLPSDGWISIYYTVARTGSESLWTYRIHDYCVALP